MLPIPHWMAGGATSCCRQTAPLVFSCVSCLHSSFHLCWHCIFAPGKWDLFSQICTLCSLWWQLSKCLVCDSLYIWSEDKMRCQSNGLVSFSLCSTVMLFHIFFTYYVYSIFKEPYEILACMSIYLLYPTWIGSCDGKCGGKSGGFCYCDSFCANNGDCCDDVTMFCGKFVIWQYFNFPKSLNLCPKSNLF